MASGCFRRLKTLLPPSATCMVSMRVSPGVGVASRVRERQGVSTGQWGRLRAATATNGLVAPVPVRRHMRSSCPVRNPGGEGKMASFDHVTFDPGTLRSLSAATTRRSCVVALRAEWPPSPAPAGSRYYFARPEPFPSPSSAAAFAPAPSLPLLRAGAFLLFDARARQGGEWA